MQVSAPPSAAGSLEHDLASPVPSSGWQRGKGDPPRREGVRTEQVGLRRHRQGHPAAGAGGPTRSLRSGEGLASELGQALELGAERKRKGAGGAARPVSLEASVGEGPSGLPGPALGRPVEGSGTLWPQSYGFCQWFLSVRRSGQEAGPWGCFPILPRS